VTELADGGSVNDLLVRNPLDIAVLLYEGEEVLGAQQNRTFDASILVAPKSELPVPVSCVEAGRWDGDRHAESFTVAPQAAYPALRRAKSAQARERMAAGGPGRAVQGAVWDEVAAKAERLPASSPTAAMHDIFEQRREYLDSVVDAVKARRGQVGALVAIAGRFVVLDHVGAPGVWEALHRALVQGYGLDALEAAETDPPTLDDARGFLDLLRAASCTPAATVGMGKALTFAGRAADGRELAGRTVAGTALTCDDQTVALTAFPEDGQELGLRVIRPSRRRRS
jgi:hypothetical protein